MIRFASVLLLSAALFSATAFAHVTANPNEGEAGKYFETEFRVSHGCEGSDTVSISIQLPKGFVSVKPQHKAGWKVDIRKSKLDKPVPAGHGKMADEQFDSVTWSGGKLPDVEYDEFGLLLKLPDHEGTLWFPVIQTCEKGENRWTEVPQGADQWHNVKSPAPFVKIKPAAPATGHQH